MLEAGIVSEETYIEQGMYWSELYHPLIRYILKTYQPDVALVGFPVTDEVQHQFLGLVTPTLPNGAANPAYDDVQVNGTPDGRVEEREEFIKEAYVEADRTMRLAQDNMGTKDLTTFVSSDHGFAPQFAAIDASLVLKNLGLLSTVQTANCRLAAGETIGRAKACWAGGALQIYLNLAGRDPAPPAPQSQVPANQEAATVAAIRAAFEALVDPNDWTGDGNPEGWKVIDRTFTKAGARAIPNGPGSTADMANPTRTGDAVVFAYPPYQFDAATPNTLIARSAFFGQHGYVPDVQNLDANVNMRATFLAGGKGIRRTTVAGARSIDLAATAAFLADIPVPQQSQGRVLTEILRNPSRYEVVNIIGLNDFHGQLDPTTTTRDGFTTIPVGGAAALATMFDQEAAALPGDTVLVAAGDNVGASPPNSALLEDAPAIDVENLWGMDATSYGNHEFDFGVERILQHLERAEFPFLSTNIVDETTGEPPEWLDRSTVVEVNGIRVGIIGATVRTTPELVRPDATAGLEFLDEAEEIQRESEWLRRQGVRVQVVVIHEGATLGANRIGATAAAPWDGPIVGIVEQLQDTTVDLVIAGHTHRIANTVIGRIPVAEGVNAGGSYSVAQLVVQGRDVVWAGAATRVATNLGVAQRADVKAVVDAANTATAPLRNRVIGSQTASIVRDPTRLNESAMGNFVADSMLERYVGEPHQAEAAITNSGGLRADLPFAPLPGGVDLPGQITWGEAFAVLPFGNATVIETLTYEQLIAALTNGFSPVCNPLIATGRFPQVAGLRITYTCSGTSPANITVFKGASTTAMGPGETVRIVTNDFMFTGGDGYTALTGGTDVAQTGELLLDVVIEDITATSPVSPPPLGRITRL